MLQMRQEISIMECSQDQNQQKNESEFWILTQSAKKKLEDEYLLGDVIGRGTSSVTHKCLRKGRTEWACKILKKEFLDKKLFQREIHSLLDLKHPNIAQLKDVFETSDEILFIFELAKGGELFERIVEKGQFTEEDASRAVHHVLNALQYLHNKGISHRGVIPENLLYKSVADDSILQLSDFGMSRLMSDEYQAANRMCGTFGLCAPEILNNQAHDLSIDLWCLGVVLYIMLCGFEPFWDEQSQTVTKKKVLTGDCSFPSPWWDGISDSAKDLLSKLLAAEPKHRPTATEALNHPWVTGTSISSLPMTKETLAKLKEFNAKRRFRVATTAVIATQRALSYLPTAKIGDCKNKAVHYSSSNVSTDSSTILKIKTNDHCVRSLQDRTSNGHERSEDTLENQPVGGTSVEEKLSTNLLTDLSSQYKETYIDTR